MVSAALVGLGWWGTTIAHSLEGSAMLRLTRAIDTDPARAEWAKARGLAFSTTLDPALTDPAIDAIILCTPHSQHTAQVARAAAAGKHVFCEKPLALSRREAEASVAACRAAGVVLGVGHERRFEPPFAALRRLVDEGELGTLLQIEASFCQDKFLTLPPGNWRLSSVEAPAGPLTATGIHLLDLAVNLLGPAVRVAASLRRTGSKLANGDTLGALVSFESGANLLLSAILATPFAGRLMVYGDKAWVELRDKAHPESPAGWVLTTCRRDEAPVSAEFPPAPSVRNNLEAFATAAAGGAPYPIRSDEMIATAAALEAVIAAVASGKTEPVAAQT